MNFSSICIETIIAHNTHNSTLHLLLSFDFSSQNRKRATIYQLSPHHAWFYRFLSYPLIVLWGFFNSERNPDVPNHSSCGYHCNFSYPIFTLLYSHLPTISCFSDEKTRSVQSTQNMNVSEEWFLFYSINIFLYFLMVSLFHWWPPRYELIS